MANIHVVCGGDSSEREVSLRSGNAVAEALRTIGHEVTVLDTSDSDEAICTCDVVFPVLHGVGGEDGQLQARLEKCGVRFVGTGSVASQLCMNKAAYREKMLEAGFLMAQGTVVTKDSYGEHSLSRAPHVLKPIDGGSTIDTYIVRDATNIDQSLVADYFSRHEQMILEELIVGDEITVGVLGEKALPVIEIIPPQNEDFDYENKYNGKTQELCPPLHVAEHVQQKAQELTVAIHKLAGCRDFSRTDFIVTANEKYYLLETNTIPGMTGQSLYPKMAATAGIAFPELCDQLTQMALNR